MYPDSKQKERAKFLGHQCWHEKELDADTKCVVQAVKTSSKCVVVRSVCFATSGACFVLETPYMLEVKFQARQKLHETLYSLSVFDESTRHKLLAILQPNTPKAAEFKAVKLGNMGDKGIIFELENVVTRAACATIAREAHARKCKTTNINVKRIPTKNLFKNKKDYGVMCQKLLEEIGLRFGEQPCIVAEPLNPTLTMHTNVCLEDVYQRWHFDAWQSEESFVLWSVVILLTGGEMTDFVEVPNRMHCFIDVCKELRRIEVADPPPVRRAPAFTLAMFRHDMAHRGRPAQRDSFCPVALSPGRVVSYFQVAFSRDGKPHTSEVPAQLDMVCGPWYSKKDNEVLLSDLIKFNRVPTDMTIERLIDLLRLNNIVKDSRQRTPHDSDCPTSECEYWVHDSDYPTSECEYWVGCKLERKTCSTCKVQLCSLHMQSHHDNDKW